MGMKIVWVYPMGSSTVDFILHTVISAPQMEPSDTTRRMPMMIHLKCQRDSTTLRAGFLG